MVFIASLTILLYLVIALCLRAVSNPPGGNSLQSARRTMVIFLLPATLLLVPLFIEVIQVNRFMKGESVSMGYEYIPMIMVGAGGVALLAAFGFRLYRQRSRPTTGFFSVGASVTGLVISAYMVFVSLDQFMFFVPDRNDVGVLNWEYFRGQAPDIKCDSNILLVNGVNSKVPTYRCPSMLQITLGRFSGAPFVAWPSYTEGHSEQLATVIRKLHDDAIKTDK